MLLFLGRAKRIDVERLTQPLALLAA